MKILPVLDLLNGIVVRGIAGRRSEYQPIQSILTDSYQPLDVARALQSQFGFDRFYVADLDAILHEQPHWELYERLVDVGFQLLVDAGIRDARQAVRLQKCGAEPIVGLESCANPNVLAGIVTATDGEVTFSLDLMNGTPLLSADANAWNACAMDVACQAIDAGVRRLIVLDLADVGTGSGGKTGALCRSLREEFPQIVLTAGGGIRGLSDVVGYRSLGVSELLVASALHDGRLTPENLKSLGEV